MTEEWTRDDPLYVPEHKNLRPQAAVGQEGLQHAADSLQRAMLQKPRARRSRPGRAQAREAAWGQHGLRKQPGRRQAQTTPAER